MAKVRIVGSDQAFEATEGADLLRVLQDAHFPISTSCGGRASCGLCRLTVVSGQAELTPIMSEEVNHLGNVAKVIGTRLACQARICGTGEVVVEVPTVEDVEARKRQKAERLQRERALNRARVAAGLERSSNVPTARVSIPPRGSVPPPRPTVPPRASYTPPNRASDQPRLEWRPRKLEGKQGGGE